MTKPRFLSCPLLLAVAISACSGSIYPVGSQQQSNGGTANTGGASGIASGGMVALGGSQATGGSSGSSSSGASSAAGASSVQGTGGLAPTGGAAATGGAGGLGASSTGGSAAPGVHSRVAFIDPISNQFLAYDREGQIVHDYASLIKFNDSFDERIVCIGQHAVNWDTSTNNAYFSSVAIAPPGKFPPMVASEILVRARRVSAGSVNVRIASAAGSVIDEFPVPGDFTVFQSSPSRQYVLGSVESLSGVLVRRSSHAVVWQGQLFEAAFTPDDEHLLVLPNNDTKSLVILETSTGRTSNVDLASLPAAFSASSPSLLSVEGALNEGAVVSIDRSDYSGHAIFWVTWDGSIRPFDATLPAGVDEYVYSTNGDDTRVAWWRNAHSSSTAVEPSLLGWFEFDFSNMTSRALPNLGNTSKDCYDPLVSTYYELSATELLSCPCGGGACAPLASLTLPSEPAWLPKIALSPRRGIVGYSFDWPLNRMPGSWAVTELFNPQGSRLAKLDGQWFQWFEFDLLDDLVLATSNTVISAVTGHSTALSGTGTAILYE